MKAAVTITLPDFARVLEKVALAARSRRAGQADDGESREKLPASDGGTAETRR